MNPTIGTTQPSCTATGRRWRATWAGTMGVDPGRQRFSETGPRIGRRETPVLRGVGEAGELSSEGLLGLYQPPRLYPAGSPPLLAAGMGGRGNLY